MVEALFQIGFVLALVLPPAAVMMGVILIALPRLSRAAGAAHASVHPEATRVLRQA